MAALRSPMRLDGSGILCESVSALANNRSKNISCSCWQTCLGSASNAQHLREHDLREPFSRFETVYAPVASLKPEFISGRRRGSGGFCAPYRSRSFIVRSGTEDKGQLAALRGGGVGGCTDINYALAMLEQLKSQMDVATMREDYAEAARIRDTMKMLLDKDPALQLKISIDKAVAEERYEDAAKYRNELETLAQRSESELNCYSNTTTQGIRVQVRSVYISDRSQPSKGQYFFAYRIRISNECSRPVQLLSRHWVITDASGRTEQSRGVGVIGEQPVLLPGTNFEYTSACPLGTSTGRMEGDFEMRYMDEATTLTFNIRVGPFALSVRGDEKTKSL